jgi:hypothetical protein
MDKLETIYVLARKLDQAADEELLAQTQTEKAQARARMIEAEAEYARALDALHEARATSNDDDATTPADFARAD